MVCVARASTFRNPAARRRSDCVRRRRQSRAHVLLQLAHSRASKEVAAAEIPQVKWVRRTIRMLLFATFSDKSLGRGVEQFHGETNARNAPRRDSGGVTMIIRRLFAIGLTCAAFAAYAAHSPS